jgi:hypothetical protein
VQTILANLRRWFSCWECHGEGGQQSAVGWLKCKRCIKKGRLL